MSVLLGLLQPSQYVFDDLFGKRAEVQQMSRKPSLSDFRAVRMVLEPDDFALSDGKPDPPPSDRVSKKTWVGITTLPDDVAIRTSDHNGKVLGEVYWLWGRWIEAIGEPEDALFEPMLDANDDLQTSIFNALHGYYRAGFAALRNVLELMTIGMCGSFQNSDEYVSWRNGAKEFSFGKACDQLAGEPQLITFNTRMREAGYQSLWDAKKGLLTGGCARRVYRELSNYAHSRPGFTDADLRKSNGPIYVGRVFWDWYYAYLRTVSLCSILVRLVRRNEPRETMVRLFTNDADVVDSDLREAFRLLKSHKRVR